MVDDHHIEVAIAVKITAGDAQTSVEGFPEHLAAIAVVSTSIVDQYPVGSVEVDHEGIEIAIQIIVSQGHIPMIRHIDDGCRDGEISEAIVEVDPICREHLLAGFPGVEVSIAVEISQRHRSQQGSLAEVGRGGKFSQPVVEQHPVRRTATGDHGIEVSIRIDIAEGHAAATQLFAEELGAAGELTEALIEPDLAGGVGGRDTGVEIAISIDISQCHIGGRIAGPQRLTVGTEVSQTVIDPHLVSVVSRLRRQRFGGNPCIDVAIAIEISQRHRTASVAVQCLAAVDEVAASIVEQDEIYGERPAEVHIEISIAVQICQCQVSCGREARSGDLKDRRLTIGVVTIDSTIAVVIDPVIADL